MELVDREAVEDHQRKEPTVIDALELNAENKVQLDRLRDEAKSLGARQKTAEEQLKRTQLQLETRLSEQAHELAQSKKALQETLTKLQDYEKEFQQQSKTIETLNAEGAHNKEVLEKKLADIDALRSQLDQVKAEIEQTKQALQSQQASIEAAVNSGSRGCSTRACGQCSIL